MLERIQNNSTYVEETRSPLQHPEEEIKKILDDEAENFNGKEMITEIKTCIPFQNYSTSLSYPIYHEPDDQRSKTVSNDSNREEATIRMSTQFLDSRHSNKEESYNSVYTTPEANKYLAEKGIKQPNKRNISKQWKVCMFVFILLPSFLFSFFFL